MKYILCLGLALALAQGAPTNPEEGDLFEGDILLEDGQDYNAIRNSRKMWPNGIIPYTVKSATASERATLNAAIADYNKYTCIRWVPRTNQMAYVSIVKGAGCYSVVGTLRHVQTLSLGHGCWTKGIIIHEMMHAVGFFHEQSRSDRDNYVTIMLQNVKTGMEHNFNKYSSGQVNDLLTYDYGSVMHYQATAFSKNGEHTIVPKTSGARIGQRVGFSQLDIQKVNMLYKCNGGGGGMTTPKPTIRPTTRRLTTPENCQDRYSNCQWFKSNGYCDRPQDGNYYRSICPKSCGIC
ncbi:unnamed protein product [Owenia fusiformis]|uniref:Metalloendopeptidase n=1 Tax=Owenia fusiformis TaxID=6347 RepID=A0A8J1XSL9_OWEFU|nr:unnamed protein product [Owenia fusiformis]